MSNRNIADLFGESATRVGEDEENNNVNDNDNGDVNNSVNVNKTLTEQTGNKDILNLIKEDNDKKVVGFHLDKDIRQAFKNVLGDNPPRGAQSKLANKIFRDFFESRGLL